MGLILDLILVSTSQVLFFIGSWWFFVQKISGTGEYRAKNRVVLTLFAATFCLSATLFELIIFEILDIMERRLRWFLWKLSLVSMLTFLIVVLPVYQIRLLVVGKNRGNMRRASLVR